MREILFRGKRIFDDDWGYGFAYKQYSAAKVEEWYIRAFETDFLVIPETVCQFTGLTDKNGRKIFEGDIVEGNSEYFTYTHPYGKVVYDGGQYLISFDDVLEDIECLGAWANDVEIIGNIYDNPELLEGS